MITDPYSLKHCCHLFRSLSSLRALIKMYASHLNKCEMIAHCDFDLHFPDD